eukprot:47870-Chlamydomonas_euryale.AAC.1
MDVWRERRVEGCMDVCRERATKGLIDAWREGEQDRGMRGACKQGLEGTPLQPSVGGTPLQPSVGGACSLLEFMVPPAWHQLSTKVSHKGPACANASAPLMTNPYNSPPSMQSLNGRALNGRALNGRALN